MSEKQQLRRSLFEGDKAVSNDTRKQQSKAICKQIADRLLLTGNVLMFMPLGDEVDVTSLMDVIRSRGGRVILPYCVDRSHMVLKPYDEGTSLVQDVMHVLSPDVEEVIDPERIDEALIPAVALTGSGKRLGRGGGFYDRMIPKFRNDAVKVGVCYSNRVVSDIPTQEHDALVDFVVTASN